MNTKRYIRSHLISLTLLPMVLGLSMTSCNQNHEQNDASHVSVTSVKHTDVKRQSIGNCWLYAVASWMESLKLNDDETFDVSESYWTYWDWFNKLRNGSNELQTGGNWSLAKRIINQRGWVKEGEFIPEETDAQMSQRQKCAEDMVNAELEEGGRLFNDRSEETLYTVLNEAFTCGSDIKVDGKKTWEDVARSTDETLLRLPGAEEPQSMRAMLNAWRSTYSPYSRINSLKRLASVQTLANFKLMEQRIKRALNDNMPVVLSFFVSFNAVDEDGKFNLNSLAEKGDIGSSGGHMVVMHDYTVDNVPGLGRLGEGDMDFESKAAALEGDLDYIVNKNSWGTNRWDRPWIGDGYSRITWDYLTGTYFKAPEDEGQGGSFRPFLTGVVLPPGY